MSLTFIEVLIKLKNNFAPLLSVIYLFIYHFEGENRRRKGM